MNEKLELEINLALDSLQNQDIRGWFRHFYNLALKDVKEEVDRKRRIFQYKDLTKQNDAENYCQHSLLSGIIDFIEKQEA